MASDDKPVPLPEPNPSAPAVNYLGRYEIHGKPIDVYDVSPSADDPGGRTYIDPSEPNAMIIYGGGDPPLGKPLPIPTDDGGSGGDSPDGSGDPAGPGGAAPGEAPLKDTDSTFTDAPVGQTEQPCPWAALGKALDVGVGVLQGVAAAAIGTLAAGFIAGIVGPTLAPFLLGGLAVVGVIMLAKEITTLIKNDDPTITPSERRKRIGRVIGSFLFPATGQAGRFFGAGQRAGAGVRKALQGAVSKLINPPIPSGSNVQTFADKASARAAGTGEQQVAANRFFRGATKTSQDFKVTDLEGGGKRMEFFTPARNAGYGKRYVQEVDSGGNVVKEYKETLGPDGLIETKWLHGGPEE